MRYTIQITQPPSKDAEALELILALAAFDHDIQVIFSKEARSWLSNSQAPRCEGGKSLSKLLSAFPLYGIDRVFAEQPTKSKEKLIDTSIPVTWLSLEDILELHQQSDSALVL